MNRASSLKAAAVLSDIHTEKKGKERKGRSTPVEEYFWHLKCVLRLQWESATLPCRIADRLLEYVKVSQRHHVHRDLNKEEAAKYPLIMLFYSFSIAPHPNSLPPDARCCNRGKVLGLQPHLAQSFWILRQGLE